MKNVIVLISKKIVLTVADFVGLICSALSSCLKHLNISLKSGDFING